MKVTGYQEVIRSHGPRGDEFSVGLNRGWDCLCLTVDTAFDGGEIWLTPAKARELAAALTKAASILEACNDDR